MTAPLPVETPPLNDVLRVVAEAILATTITGRLVYLNPAAERLFNIRAADLLTQPLSIGALHPELGQRLDQATRENLTQPAIFEVVLPSTNTFSISLTPVREASGQLTHWVLNLHDITSFKKVEAWRSEVIQTVAHDLRNPLNLLYGATNLLRDTLPDINRDQAECFTMLRASMDRMNALLEQLLNLEHMEAGQQPARVKLSLRRVIQRTVDEFRYAAEEKHIALTFESVASAAKVLGDEAWLNRALANLLSNAIKYTPAQGEIVVRYREVDHMAFCEVIDTGHGFPEEAQARLFERFYRVRNEATRNTPGTGLGLAIVKTIVEKHEGRVWANSVEGQGSTFGFAVPLANGAR